MIHFLIAYFTQVEFLPAPDKQRHEIIGKRISFWSFFFTASAVAIFRLPILFTLAFLIPVIGAALWKEWDDYKTKKGTPERADAWHTIRASVPYVLSILMLVLIQNL